MNEAPTFFDAAEVAPVLLLFGGWGPLIFGDDWDRTLQEQGKLQEQGEGAAVLSNDFFEGARLPSTLMRAQQLSLKPVTQLSWDELAYLETEHGDAVNPLVRYFEPLDLKPQSSCPDITRDASPISSVDMDRSRDDKEVDEVNDEMAVEANDIALSLIKDPKMARLRTYLYRDHEDKSMWTLTRAPFTTKHRDPANKPPDALVLKEEPEKVWCQNTIEYIQWFEKGQSVSPMAFCGHAQLIWSNPKLWFVAPCLWHSDLTPQQQELAFQAKEAYRN
ncbi:hypothetical protein B0H15DRAFT_805454 [Mycena belliarum]|uniref:Uncharacterized protein n=1 Tax=Mycena belliarum TaxID=1033014 RepID=A0AAD6TUR0_9AGAR|nr:hypothetical protein B0H15DRAFT_805454 [Mycena belliae]